MVENLECSRADALDQSFALKLRESTRRRLGGGTEVIGDIEAIHREPQMLPLLVEPVRDGDELEQERRKPLSRRLDSQRHDTRLRLAKVISELVEQMELQLRLVRHHLLHALPRHAIEAGRANRLRGIDIAAAIGNSEYVARQV